MALIDQQTAAVDQTFLDQLPIAGGKSAGSWVLECWWCFSHHIRNMICPTDSAVLITQFCPTDSAVSIVVIIIILTALIL